MLSQKEISRKYGSQAEKTSLWKASTSGLHDKVKAALQGDVAISEGFNSYAHGRSSDEAKVAFLKIVVRHTGNVLGQLLASSAGHSAQLSPNDDSHSIFKVTSPGVADKIASELAQDPELADDLNSAELQLLVHRITRKVGRGLGDELGFDDLEHHILDVIKKLLPI